MQPAFLSELSAKTGGPRAGHGFARKNSNMAENRARVASARLNRIPASSPPLAKDDSSQAWGDIDFYYMTVNDEQVGPASIKELRSKYKAGEIAAGKFYPCVTLRTPCLEIFNCFQEH